MKAVPSCPRAPVPSQAGSTPDGKPSAQIRLNLQVVTQRAAHLHLQRAIAALSAGRRERVEGAALVQVHQPQPPSQRRARQPLGSAVKCVACPMPKGSPCRTVTVLLRTLAAATAREAATHQGPEFFFFGPIGRRPLAATSAPVPPGPAAPRQPYPQTARSRACADISGGLHVVIRFRQALLRLDVAGSMPARGSRALLSHRGEWRCAESGRRSEGGLPRLRGMCRLPGLWPEDRTGRHLGRNHLRGACRHTGTGQPRRP
jgi:hypothetical protein